MPNFEKAPLRRLGRRAFFSGGALFLAGSGVLGGKLAWAGAKPQVRLGLITDLHHADKPPSGTRHYRETLAKLAEAAERFEEQRPDLIVCLGDIIDSAPSLEAEKGYLKQIAKEFARISRQHHYVLGNHCVTRLTKPEFLGIVGQERSYYSFDACGYHFVILDACFRGDEQPYGRNNFQWTDANIPAAQAEWLQADLRQTQYKTIVFVHQCLDVASSFGVKNAAAIRKILSESGKVLGVVQGHDHRGNYQEIDGLHYCTLAAMVEGSGLENNAYAVLDILPADAIRINGFRKQKSYDWS